MVDLPKQPKNGPEMVSRWVWLAGVAILSVFLVVVIGNVGSLIGFYAWMNGWASSRLGLGYYESRALALVLAVTLVAIAPSMLAYAVLRRKKLKGAAGLTGAAVIALLLVRTVGNDVCFDRTTGKAIRYVAITPSGPRFSETPGFDPASGIPFKPYTQELADSIPCGSSVLPGRIATVPGPVLLADTASSKIPSAPLATTARTSANTPTRPRTLANPVEFVGNGPGAAENNPYWKGIALSTLEANAPGLNAILSERTQTLKLSAVTRDLPPAMDQVPGASSVIDWQLVPQNPRGRISSGTAGPVTTFGTDTTGARNAAIRQAMIIAAAQIRSAVHN